MQLIMTPPKKIKKRLKRTAKSTITLSFERGPIKHPDFPLPGRKALLKSDVEYDVVLIDATETPIERPEKSKSIFIPGRRKSTR